MPEQIRCPECNAVLRVPESLLGKNVKCPKCQTTFLAELDEPAQPEGIVREPAPTAKRLRPPPDELEQEEESSAGEELEDEEEQRPRRRKRRRRRSAVAESAVAAPAICLMLTGGFGILSDVAYLIYQMWSLPQMAKIHPPGQAPPGYEAGLKIGTAFVYIIIPLAFIWAIILLIGGLKMKKLQGYGLAVTSCVLAMLPLNCCCLMGLPFGIWGLVVLNRPEVKDSFT